MGTEPPKTTEATGAVVGSLESSAPPPQGISKDRLGEAEAEAMAALNAVPTVNFDGMSFIITSNSEVGVFGDYSDSTTVSKERYERMETLSERLSVDFVCVSDGTSNIVTGIKNEQASGTVYTHLLYVEARNVGSLLYYDTIGNIESLPFVDTKKPYYDTEFCSEMKTPTGLYALYGDACKEYERMSAVFYNDTLASRLGITELESLVSGGGWSYDKMTEYAKTAAAFSVEGAELYGILNSDEQDFFRSAYVGSGVSSVELGAKKLSVKDNRELLDTTMTKIREMTGSGAYTAQNIGDSTPENIFTSGKGLFFVSRLSAAERIYNMPDVWGVLPIPTVSGEGHRLAHAKDTHVICYPSTATDLNEIGVMIESLFSCSYKVMDAAYFDTYFHGYVRNEKSMDMLLSLFESERGEFALLFSEEFANFGKATLDAFVSSCEGGETFSALYSKNKTAANRSLAYVE